MQHTQTNMKEKIGYFILVFNNNMSCFHLFPNKLYGKHQLKHHMFDRYRSDLIDITCVFTEHAFLFNQ